MLHKWPWHPFSVWLKSWDKLRCSEWFEKFPSLKITHSPVTLFSFCQWRVLGFGPLNTLRPLFLAELLSSLEEKAWYGKISSLRAQRVSQELKQNTRLRNLLVTSGPNWDWGQKHYDECSLPVYKTFSVSLLRPVLLLVAWQNIWTQIEAKKLCTV